MVCLSIWHCAIVETLLLTYFLTAAYLDGHEQLQSVMHQRHTIIADASLQSANIRKYSLQCLTTTLQM